MPVSDAYPFMNSSPQPDAAPDVLPRDRSSAGPHIVMRRISSHSRLVHFRRLFWALVEATLFRFSFHTFSPWRAFLLRCFGARVGRHCVIRRTAHFYFPWNVSLGASSTVGDHAMLYSLGKIYVGERAMISQEAYICAGTHDHTDLALPLLTPPVTIGADAWVCARAFVGPGVTVGDGAVVAACSVVVKDVAPWSIVGGNPAKFIKPREIRRGDA